MKNIMPNLMMDFYKIVHAPMYPDKTSKIVSYGTPRMARIEWFNKLVSFSFQGFGKEYLIDMFNNHFFKLPIEEVMHNYERVINATLGEKACNFDRIRDLHSLGYLPLEIKVLEEGTLIPIQVPMIEISNTHENFAWVTNSIETLLSCSIWHPMISATVGYLYRQIVNEYYDKTVDDNIPKSRALGDYSMRGQESLESATKSSAAFLLSFLNTATIPAILYLEDYYNCDCTSEPVGYGTISTEHSVMCSNFAVDGDEITMIKRLLTELYPNQNFSVVSDSYDYWNMVDNIIPACKKEILEHEGFFGIRGDSGNPVQITTETVFRLWETFGGTINSKGYKVLDSHLKVIYGDSITPQRAKEIFHILEVNGFASNNVTLGVGSFSMQCLETENGLQPFTRDTFGIAVKATYCEVDGKEIPIYKNPKTDSDNFKKSQKGCCIVVKENGELVCKDGLNWKEVESAKGNQLKTIFKNGRMVNQCSLQDIRNRLHKGEF